MKVLLIHNRYTQPGGEDVVFEAERALLERYGHEVITFVEDNARLNVINPLKAAVDTVWSREAQRKIRKLIEETKPDIVHFHNTFLRISPAAYYACKEARVPVVQSLHNQRMFCPKATMWRNGRVCEDCVGRAFPWPAIFHACYRNSRLQTTVVASMVALHRWLKTWIRTVDIYIIFTNFFKNKFIEWGLPADKLVVKPHFVYPDPGMRSESTGQYALFIGRLDLEKGVETLLKAWQYLPNVPLKIRGNGRLFNDVATASRQMPAIKLIPGFLSKAELMHLIKGAKFLVWPSEGWYENFGLVAIEAFACGVPVIASRIGAMAEIVEDGRTGLLFEPGDPEDLAEKVAWAWAHPEEMAEMGQEARREYEAKYTAERNYEMLMAIYERAMASHSV